MAQFDCKNKENFKFYLHELDGLAQQYPINLALQAHVIWHTKLDLTVVALIAAVSKAVAATAAPLSKFLPLLPQDL